MSTVSTAEKPHVTRDQFSLADQNRMDELQEALEQFGISPPDYCAYWKVEADGKIWITYTPPGCTDPSINRRRKVPLTKFVARSMPTHPSVMQQDAAASIAATLMPVEVQLHGDVPEQYRRLYEDYNVYSCMADPAHRIEYMRYLSDTLGDRMVLAVIEREGHAARAIRWTGDDGRVFQDRVYCDHTPVKNQLLAAGADCDLWRDAYGDLHGDVRDFCITVPLTRSPLVIKWPYLDTLKMSIGDRLDQFFLSPERRPDTVCWALDGTGGGFRGPKEIRCAGCGCDLWSSKSKRVNSVRIDGNRFCPSCAYLDCRVCKQPHRRDKLRNLDCEPCRTQLAEVDDMLRQDHTLLQLIHTSLRTGILAREPVTA